MDLRNFLHKRFGKDIFTRLRENEINEERIKAEKEIERISDEIKAIHDKIGKLMLESKGHPKTLKMLNVSKIKVLRLESAAKQQEAYLESQTGTIAHFEAKKRPSTAT